MNSTIFLLDQVGVRVDSKSNTRFIVSRIVTVFNVESVLADKVVDHSAINASFSRLLAHACARLDRVNVGEATFTDLKKKDKN